MSEFKQNILQLDKKFDPKAKRHYLNGFQIVLHCHHYTTLYTQLALDASETELLADVAEESFLEVLKKYFIDNQIINLDEKIDLACQYFGAVGLGKMIVNYFGDDSGEVELIVSHLDSGWIKKWGMYDKPVNYITVGFIQAMFSILCDKPIKTFKAIEIESIVRGAKTSIFKVHKV